MDALDLMECCYESHAGSADDVRADLRVTCTPALADARETRCEIESAMWARMEDGSYPRYVRDNGLLDGYHWQHVATFGGVSSAIRVYTEFVGPDGLPAARVCDDGMLYVAGCEPMRRGTQQLADMLVDAELQVAVNKETIRKLASK